MTLLLSVLLLACHVEPGPAAPIDARAEDCFADTPGLQLPTLWYLDQDGDSFGDASTWLLACESPDPRLWSAAGGDCDDDHPGRNPAATEVCDPLDTDEDCDGVGDDLDPTVTGATEWFVDIDGDGHGAVDGGAFARCDPLSDEVAEAGDCHDLDPAIHPFMPEVVADGIDQDCDGEDMCWIDSDGDGFGSVGQADVPIGPTACAVPGLADNDEDCDDQQWSVTPAAPEICDRMDNDCDNLTDDADPSVTPSNTFYLDADADDLGDPAMPILRCDQPVGYARNALDCNDQSPFIGGFAQEVCDPLDVDEDCDGLADDQDPSASPATMVRRYADVDGDGHGDASRSGTLACDGTAGQVLLHGDCDDTNPAVHPGVVEQPADEVDADCDGLELCYCNRDGDDVGSAELVDAVFMPEACKPPAAPPQVPVPSCTAPGVPYAAAPGDCDDGDAAVDATPTLWAWDGDGDGYGDPRVTVVACSPPGGVWATNTLDCDDALATVRPFAMEVCDGIDSDCDSQVDEGIPTTTWWLDHDQDGFGSPDSSQLSCASSLPGYVRPGDADCDDNAVNSFPGAPEPCDGRDNDCDTRVDDGADCGPSAHRFEDLATGSTYQLVADPLDWSAANTACETIGYHLAWLETETEEVDVVTVAADALALRTFWLGYQRSGGSWQRVELRDGAPAGYAATAPHEVMQLPASGAPGEVVSWQEGTWIASLGAGGQAFLCEVEQ